MLDWHEGHGRNVSMTARHFGFSRPTVYRWLSRCDRRRLETLEVDPPRRFVQSMVALWSDDERGEGTSRVTWEIEPVSDSFRLVVTRDELREGAKPSSTAAGR
jgi:transposase-like protein